MEHSYVPGVVRKTVRVVHIIIGLNVGGAELMLKRLIEAHNTNNTVKHFVISLTNMGTVGRQLMDTGIAVHSLGITNIINVPIAFFKLRSLLVKIKPDIVQTWMYHADFFGGIVAKSIGYDNILWNVRSTNIDKGGSKITVVIRKFCSILSNYIPRKIICAAEASRIEHQKVGYAKDKMIVIPNGFEHQTAVNRYFSKIDFRENIGLQKDHVVVLSVGRFNEVKDHKTFIKAANLVAELIPNVKFLMIGRGVTKENQKLMRMLKEAKNPEIFVLLGERDDVIDFMLASDVFCMHSKTEGFPNVLGEAMLCGLPCISTDVGDAKYLLNDSSWIVQPSNPDELARKLYQLLSLPVSERVVLGNIGAKRIRVEFSMNKTSNAYLQLYKAIYANN